MAVGMDVALPRQQPSPLRPPARGPQQVGPGAAPPEISDGRVQDVVNNQRAAALQASAGALRSSDRAGVSRGRGQQYMADIAQQGADMAGRASAAQTEMGASAANAAARQAYENAMKTERLAGSNLLEGLRSAGSMERLNRQGWQQALYEALQRGRFGLAQQSQVDFTPLLQGLFR